MKTELLGQEKNIVRVKVEFEAGEFKTALDEAFRELTQKANIPGFRKGHIPRKVLEMRLGRDGLYNEALEKLIPDAIEQIVGDYDLDTIAAPSLKVEDIHEGQPLICELAFEVAPEVLLPELADIEVETLRPQVTDEMIEAMVKEFRMKHSTLTPVDRAAGEGDVVTVTYVTQIADSGEAEPVKSSEQKNDVDLADPSVRGEVKEVLIGKSAGETTTAEFDVDAEHEDKSIAGRRIHYDFAVQEVKERVFPDMAPEFYKQVLGVDLDSEEAFRAEVKKRMLDHLESENSAQAANSAVNTVAARSELEVPDTLLDRQMAYLRERDASEAKRRFNQEMEEVLRMSSISLAEYEQGVREKALDIVRRTLVLDAIGKKFEVEVQKEELEAEISRMAASYRIEPAKLRAMFYKNNERLVQMADELRYSKITRLVLEKVKVKDVDELSVAPDATKESADEAKATESAE